jgi:hypothetical protein
MIRIAWKQIFRKEFAENPAKPAKVAHRSMAGTSRHEGYAKSVKARRWIEKIFGCINAWINGWIKQWCTLLQ